MISDVPESKKDVVFLTENPARAAASGLDSSAVCYKGINSRDQ